MVEEAAAIGIPFDDPEELQLARVKAAREGNKIEFKLVLFLFCKSLRMLVDSLNSKLFFSVIIVISF
tara:strand:- start:2641 stop:2841 length:201 start_codon:yes stop_codon:yes gene_type:complete